MQVLRTSYSRIGGRRGVIAIGISTSDRRLRHWWRRMVVAIIARHISVVMVVLIWVPR